MPSKKQRENLLAEMQAEMSQTKHELENNVTTLQRHDVSDAPPIQQQKKKISNVPWYPPSEKLKKEIKQLAYDEETSISKLITEGLGYVLEKRGKAVNDYK
jgi:hypothetical protein